MFLKEVGMKSNSCNLDSVKNLIALGGDKKLVEAVLGKVSICLCASVNGKTMRFILKNGKATTIWATKDDMEIASKVISVIGERCELRLSS